MSLILKGIDMPTKIKTYQILPNGDVYEISMDGLLISDEPCQAIQIPKDDEEAIDILMKVRQGIREGEDHEPNIKRG